jgi:predicted metallopeptidase
MPQQLVDKVTLADLEYQRSDEVRDVAEMLLAKHPTLDFIEQFAVTYLLRDVTGDLEDKEIDAIAKCHKVPAMYRDVFGPEVMIWVDARYWKVFNQPRREAVVLHELCHISQDDQGRLKLVKHDVEEFAMVVRQYGPWLPTIEHFGEQLNLFAAATNP